MVRLEELTKGTVVRGFIPNSLVTIIDAQWYGNDTVELTYKDASGILGHEIVFRDKESTLDLVTEGHPWSFTADGSLLRLVSEATAFALLIYSTPYLPFIPPSLNPCPTKSLPFMGKCSLANRCATCWQMTLVLGRQLWQGCSFENF
jgi:hypothetical protein